MMGRQTADQPQFFYAFKLDERIPKAHLLRRIDVFVTKALAEVHQEMAAFYSHTGRPSIDPELLLRMLIVGYCYGIRSERKLCEEVSLNLTYRWFCRLDLDGAVPDHSSFSKNRHGRFRDSDLLRGVFERVVGICLTVELIKGEGFAVDASVIEADACRYHGVEPEKIDWNAVEKPSRAVREYLDARAFAGTPEFEQSRNERKNVEMLFAHLKTTLRFERMRLRGLSGARDKFLMAAIAQNLRRLVRLTMPIQPRRGKRAYRASRRARADDSGAPGKCADIVGGFFNSIDPKAAAFSLLVEPNSQGVLNRRVDFQPTQRSQCPLSLVVIDRQSRTSNPLENERRERREG
jgi:transposase